MYKSDYTFKFSYSLWYGLRMWGPLGDTALVISNWPAFQNARQAQIINTVYWTRCLVWKETANEKIKASDTRNKQVFQFFIHFKNMKIKAFAKSQGSSHSGGLLQRLNFFTGIYWFSSTEYTGTSMNNAQWILAAIRRRTRKRFKRSSHIWWLHSLHFINLNFSNVFKAFGCFRRLPSSCRFSVLFRYLTLKPPNSLFAVYMGGTDKRCFEFKESLLLKVNFLVCKSC